MKRYRTLLVGVALCGGLLILRSGSTQPPSGKVIADFTLKDTQGKAVSLAQFKDKKAVVLVFVGTECPVNNFFLPRLNELHKEFALRGVQFLAVNANRQDTPPRIAEHAKKHALAFPVLRDELNKVADLVGAKRTPEAVLLDGERKVRYQGRIDDQFGIGYQRNQPTRRDLAEAINEVLAGKQVSVPSTTVAGCYIARVSVPKQGAVTYAKHVSRIVQNRCQECHRPGHIGPMALLTYSDVSAWAETIREVVQENRMPPWHADPRFGKFSNDRSLSKEDRETLLTWIEQGCPRGDEKDLPPAKEYVPGWRIGKPDVVLHMPVEYAVPAVAPKGGIPYQYFSVKTDFPEDRWVERAESQPGRRRWCITSSCSWCRRARSSHRKDPSRPRCRAPPPATCR